MKKKVFLRTIALLLSLICLIPSVFCSCGSEVTADGATVLSFKSASSYDYLKKLDGKKVAIKGWFSTTSPPDNSFLFLMNMPYQSCIFCKPNTNQLSNTIEVYPKKGKSLEYTSQVVQVVGTLTVAPLDKPYSDDFGYEFNYKIVDAEYYLLDDGDLSDNLVLWQKVANSGIVLEISKMLDYLNFVCNWCVYFVEGEDYLYPEDAEYYIYTNGAQYNYGYKDGYFESLISKVLKIDKNNLSDLVNIIQSSKLLAAKAISEFENKNYSVVSEYSLYFGDGRWQYKMNDASISKQCDDLKTAFAYWIAAWEL